MSTQTNTASIASGEAAAIPERPRQQEEQPPKKEIVAEDVFEPHILAKYDPEAVEIILRVARLGAPPLHKVPIAERRAHPEKYPSPWAKDVSSFERARETEIASSDGAKFPVAIYTPDAAKFGDGPWGCHLNFHGESFLGPFESVRPWDGYGRKRGV
jgi:hypothetical protein